MNYLNELALIQTHGDIWTDTGSPAGSAPSFVALWLQARQLRGPRPTFQNPAVWPESTKLQGLTESSTQPWREAFRSITEVVGKYLKSDRKSLVSLSSNYRGNFEIPGQACPISNLFLEGWPVANRAVMGDLWARLPLARPAWWPRAKAPAGEAFISQQLERNDKVKWTWLNRMILSLSLDPRLGLLTSQGTRRQCWGIPKKTGEGRWCSVPVPTLGATTVKAMNNESNLTNPVRIQNCCYWNRGRAMSCLAVPTFGRGRGWGRPRGERHHGSQSGTVSASQTSSREPCCLNVYVRYKLMIITTDHKYSTEGHSYQPAT